MRIQTPFGIYVLFLFVVPSKIALPSIFLLKRKDLRDEKHKYRYDVVPVDILKAALHRIDVKMHTRSF